MYPTRRRSTCSGPLLTIGAVVDNGDGSHTAELDPNDTAGEDLFVLTVDDGIRPVVLPPLRTRLPSALLLAIGFESGSTGVWN